MIRPLNFFGVLAAGLGALSLSAAAKPITLGPRDPGAELGGAWYSGTNGAGFRFVDDTDPKSGHYDFTLGNRTVGKGNVADWRSGVFRLGPASGGDEPITFSFDYKVPGKVSRGDNISVSLRFFDDTGAHFLGQTTVMLGSDSGDSEMTDYKTVTLTGILAMKNATGIVLPKKARTATADIWVTCNVFRPWTSGDAHFDNFSVTTRPAAPWVARHWIINLVVLLIMASFSALAIWFIRQRHRA